MANKPKGGVKHDACQIAKQKSAKTVRDNELLCCSCECWKPDEAFSRRNRTARRGRVSKCIDCVKKYYKENQDKWKNPDGSWRDSYAVRGDIERRNELSRLRYEKNSEVVLARARARTKAREVIAKCPICGVTCKLVRDHCHLTEKQRGRICNPCNLMIGHGKDDPEVLRGGARYLERQEK